MNDQIKLEVKHIFESGANEIRVVELIERLLFKYIDACQTVVSGYEGDGMECMDVRDEVFYRVCKDAIETSPLANERNK